MDPTDLCWIGVSKTRIAIKFLQWTFLEQQGMCDVIAGALIAIFEGFRWSAKESTESAKHAIIATKLTAAMVLDVMFRAGPVAGSATHERDTQLFKMAASAVPTLHEKHGTVVIYSPYINKHKSIQEVSTILYKA